MSYDDADDNLHDVNYLWGICWLNGGVHQSASGLGCGLDGGYHRPVCVQTDNGGGVYQITYTNRQNTSNHYLQQQPLHNKYSHRHPHSHYKQTPIIEINTIFYLLRFSSRDRE